MISRTMCMVGALCTVLWAQGDSIVPEQGDMSWQTFPTDLPVVAFTPAGRNVWYAAGGPVVKLNHASMKMEMFEKLGSLPASAVTCMATDRDGNVWIGTSEGVARRTARGFSDFTVEQGLPDNAVTSIVSKRRGEVWVGTAGGVARYADGKWTAYTADNGLCNNDVRDLAGDNSGNLWVGTAGGISRFDGSTWTTFNTGNGLSFSDTKALGYDERKNHLWAAVGESDVNRFDGREWKIFMSIREGITSIMVDTQSRVWFGSMSGLLKFNGDAWVDDPSKLGISAAQVSSMYRDAQGNMWFGTGRGVLYLKNPYPF